jgi:membrane protein implicated in regulation of membrane protease activity
VGRREYDETVAAWLAWLIAAAALTVGEILTPGLIFLGPVALAAVVAAVVAAVGGGILAELIAFILGSLLGLGLLRPIARRHIHLPAQLRTGTAALEGASAVVLERVTADGGRIRLGGEVWSARTYMDDEVFEPGSRVDVLKIDGATALVH